MQQKHHRNNRNNRHRFRRNTKPAPVKKEPERVYTDADLHMDILNASFVDIRQVQTGTHEDGQPIIEYISEEDAKERGFHDQWVLAEAIDKGLKAEETD